MYVMLVKVHEISWVTPGIMSKRIFAIMMRTGCIVQAPVHGQTPHVLLSGWSGTFGIEPL